MGHHGHSIKKNSDVPASDDEFSVSNKTPNISRALQMSDFVNSKDLWDWFGVCRATEYAVFGNPSRVATRH